jgi:hypothetical protein
MRIASCLISFLGGLIVSERSLFIRFFGLGNHNTLSRPKLVRSVFKTAECIIKATSIDILHPKFRPAHCPDILPSLNFIFSYASMSTLRSAIVFISPTNLPLPDGSSLASFFKLTPLV